MDFFYYIPSSYNHIISFFLVRNISLFILGNILKWIKNLNTWYIWVTRLVWLPSSQVLVCKMIIDLVTVITHQKSKSKIGCLWRRQGKYFDICWKVLKCRAWWQELPPGLERKLTETWQVIIWAKNNKTNVSLLWLLVKTKIIHFPPQGIKLQTIAMKCYFGFLLDHVCSKVKAVISNQLNIISEKNVVPLYLLLISIFISN